MLSYKALGSKFFRVSYGPSRRLIMVIHMYSFPPFYAIQSHSLCCFLNWNVFLTTSTNVNFWSSSTAFLFPPWIISLYPTGALIDVLHTWPNSLKRISLIFSSIGIIPIFKRIFSFWTKSYLFVYFHLSILTFSYQIHSFYEHASFLLIASKKFNEKQY